MKDIFLKKYKPVKFSDFQIEKEYINLLNSLIKLDNLNILFIGNSGSGKSTLIDSTIKEYYNTENYHKSNVLNINSLMDQGISYYRTEVKTFCQTPSITKNKKKFLVLDDIDNINDQSQQVFRNCIDKYGNNVHFIGSCKNINKVIESLQSRTILIKIKDSNKNNIEIIIKKIMNSENISITSDAIDFLILVSNNSIRQVINYMEKFKLLDQNIDLETIKNICTNISFYEFEIFTNLWKNKQIKEACVCLKKLYDKGYSVIDILDNYFNFIKIQNDIDEDLKCKIIIKICDYIRIFNVLHEDEIELYFFVWELSNIK